MIENYKELALKKRAEDFVKLLQEQNNAKHLDAGTSLES